MIIRSDGLNKSFRRNHAVRGISLAVPEGSIYALIGQNGAGKTTTIKTLLNILMPTSGRAEVLGVDSRRLSPTEFAQIGYVSENQELPARLTVRAYLDYLRPFYPTWDATLEQQLVTGFQLPAGGRIRELSRGMRMKVGLAAALCYRPRLLVMDEPFSGLDPLVRDELLETLSQQSKDMTVFVSSHEIDEIESRTSHVGYLEDGKLLFQESMADLTARVREVRVTLDDDARLPGQIPATWLNLSVSGNVVSFVDVRFSHAALQAAVQSLFSGVRDIDAHPATLRTIFTTLARSRRNNESLT